MNQLYHKGDLRLEAAVTAGAAVGHAWGGWVRTHCTDSHTPHLLVAQFCNWFQHSLKSIQFGCSRNRILVKWELFLRLKTIWGLCDDRIITNEVNSECLVWPPLTIILTLRLNNLSFSLRWPSFSQIQVILEFAWVGCAIGSRAVWLEMSSHSEKTCWGHDRASLCKCHIAKSVTPGIRLAVVLPSTAWLVTQSRWLPITRAPTRPGSCSLRCHGIWFASNWILRC